MKLLVGLGNKGSKYQNNRHNVGFLFVDRVFSTLGRTNTDISFEYNSKLDSLICQAKGLILIKPQTMMNASGIAVSRAVSFYKINLSNLWLSYDDLDIALGEYKIVFGKPPKTHNGVYSVINLLGVPDFWHIRLGVENRNKESKEKGEEYVLKNFLPDEEKIINETIDRAVLQFLKEI